MPIIEIQSVTSQQHATATASTASSTSIAPTTIAVSPLDENFTRRLIEAVKAQPCLYNPNHEHYGNKHSSSQYRIQVWQKLRAELGFKDDAHALQMQWKRIRDRYVRERRKRRNASSNEMNHDSSVSGRERHASGGSNCSTSSNIVNVSTSSPSRQFTEMMRWIEPFMIDNMTNNSLHALSVNAAVTNCAGNSQHQHLNSAERPTNVVEDQSGGVAVTGPTAVSEAGTYYMHHNERGNSREGSCQDTSIGAADDLAVRSYAQTSQSQLIHVQTSRNYDTSCNHALLNGANDSSNTSVLPTSPTDNGSPCSSTTSSEIDVGTSTTTSFPGPQQMLLQRQRQREPSVQQPSSMAVLSAVQTQMPSFQQQSTLLPKTEQRSRIGQPLQTGDGGVVTVTARGIAPVSGVIKKDVNVRTNDGGTVTMIIDPTTFYQHGSQKMYRLVNVSELSADALSVSTNNSVPAVSGELRIVGIPQRRKRVATLNVQGMPNGRGQLSDEALDNGISEKTITINQGSVAGNGRILLDHQSANTVPGPSVMLGHNVQQLHQQQQLTNSPQLHSGVSVSQLPTTVPAPHASQIGIQQTSLRQQQQTGQRFMTQGVTMEHPHYTILRNQSSMQEEHDANLAFANSIANHLSRLNEDEKAVAKMNIQRILMDARFGLGACARMIHDEELSEVVAAVSTSSHDVVSAQQRVGGASRRIT